jgi:hypothetical protein
MEKKNNLVWENALLPLLFPHAHYQKICQGMSRAAYNTEHVKMVLQVVAEGFRQKMGKGSCYVLGSHEGGRV